MSLVQRIRLTCHGIRDRSVGANGIVPGKVTPYRPEAQRH
nr:hypothetical protein [Kibdelosporangium sp. MJ126-NF4]CTQ91986.1 hypothetical protein [Kibdelosporangium sp. MJ126-NF4]